MPTPKSRLVRVMPEEQIVAITGTLPYATSIGRSWAGVEVHRYKLSGPSQTTEFRLPPALTRRVSIERSHELTAIFLEPVAFSDIARCEAGAYYPEIRPQFAISDPVVRSLGMTLDAETRSHNPRPAFQRRFVARRRWWVVRAERHGQRCTSLTGR